MCHIKDLTFLKIFLAAATVCVSGSTLFGESSDTTGSHESAVVPTFRWVATQTTDSNATINDNDVTLSSGGFEVWLEWEVTGWDVPIKT